MIKAVIFDVDGTLVDSVDLHARAWQETFREFGKDIPFQEIRMQIGKGGDQLMPVLGGAARHIGFGSAPNGLSARGHRRRHVIGLARIGRRDRWNRSHMGGDRRVGSIELPTPGHRQQPGVEAGGVAEREKLLCATGEHTFLLARIQLPLPMMMVIRS
jgi:haloacid dehalogenase-like hydrolase